MGSPKESRVRTFFEVFGILNAVLAATALISVDFNNPLEVGKFLGFAAGVNTLVAVLGLVGAANDALDRAAQKI